MPSHAALRLERFQKAQAALDASLRLENRDDLDVTHHKHRMASTLEQHRAAKRWFIEYLQMQTPDLDPQRFFDGHHPAPDRVLLKKYAIFMAQSRVGVIADTISVRTLINYIRLLFAVLGIDRGAPLDRTLTNEIQAYIHNDMAKEYQISREHWKKPVAHSEDLTHLISVLYRPDSMGTLSNMRQLLNLTLFLNIMVDTGSRGGDIAWDRKTDAGTCLLWSDVKLYAFWNEAMGAVDTRANLTFRHLKGMRLEPSKYKTVPFSLFPTSMCKEDTLRLILIMALMDDVLEGDIRTWADLMAVPSSANGIIIPIKERFRTLPLLRKVEWRSCALTEGPELLRDLQGLTRRLGRAAGLEDRLTVYCLRRGVAFTLALKTSSDNRRFLMGHKTASRIYSEYASKTATVDLAALYRDHDPRSVKQMSSMLLNSSEHAPQSISSEGRAMAKLDPKYVALNAASNALREALIQRHGTLAAAARTMDPDLATYKTSYSHEMHALHACCEKIYREEYAAFFESNMRSRGSSSTRNSMGSALPTRSDDTSGVPPSEATRPPSALSNRSTSTGLADGVFDDSTTDASSIFLEASDGFFEEWSSSADEADDSTTVELGELTNIDPILLAMSGDLLALEGREDSIQSTLGDVEPAPPSPPVDTKPDEVESAQPMPSVRRHGISRRDEDAINAHVSKTGLLARRDNSGIDRTYVDPAFCSQKLAVFDANGSEADLAAGLANLFMIVHPIDRFYPGHEPFPGTYNCFLCGKHLNTIVHASLHVYKCALKVATDATCQVVDELFPFNQPCTFTLVKKVNGIMQLVECGKTFKDRKTWGFHVSTHISPKAQMIRDQDGDMVPSCFYPPCAQVQSSPKDPRPGIIFESREERVRHLMTHHQIISTSSPRPTFCEFCYEFVLPHELDAHFDGHLDAAHHIVETHGYTGIMGIGRTLVPRLCIFCYHDTGLGTSQRLDTQCSQGSIRFLLHIMMHIKAIEEPVTCPAFPKFCALSDPLNAEEMRAHLAVVHALIVKDEKPKAKRKSRAKPTSTRRKRKGAKTRDENELEEEMEHVEDDDDEDDEEEQDYGGDDDDDDDHE